MLTKVAFQTLKTDLLATVNKKSDNCLNSYRI